MEAKRRALKAVALGLLLGTVAIILASMALVALGVEPHVDALLEGLAFAAGSALGVWLAYRVSKPPRAY
jgi:uncharacterized PurR-regulated membrane protein YhhQ (DUF165 family)